MNATELDHRIPSSLYCDLFYNNPGAAEFRRDHLRVWLQVELYRIGEGDLSKLTSTFKNAYPGVEIAEGDVENVLTSLSESGEVHNANGRSRLTPEGISSVRSAETRHNRSRQKFLDGLATYLRNSPLEDLSDAELASAQGCAEDLIIRVLLDEREALEYLYEHLKDFAYVSNRARERSAELSECLERKLPDTLGTRLRELRREGLHALAEAIEEGRAYLHTLNRSVVCSFFLIKDPYHVENIRAHATKRTYFLDTNVYLAWLYPSQPAHEIVRPLMETLRHYGAGIQMLPETVEEIRRIEQQAERSVPRALGEPSFRQFMLVNRKAILTDFLWARDRDKNLDYATFKQLHTDPERTLPRLGITVVAVEFEASEDFLTQVPTFRNAVRGAKQDRGRTWAPEALDHDAAALVAMAKLQLQGERDDWGARTQLLSLDRTLGPAVEECRNVLGRRFDWPIHPNSLARLLMPASGAELERAEYEDFVVGAVRENLGLLDEVSGYSPVNIIEKLDRAGIPTRTLLEAPPNLLEHALAQLQGKKDLNRKLDQAIATVPEDRRPIVAEIQRDLEEAISVGSDLLHEKEVELTRELSERRRLHGEVQELRDEMDRLKETVMSQGGALAARGDEISGLRAAARTRLQRELFVGVVIVLLAAILWLVVFL